MNTTTVLQNLATWVLWNSSGAAVLVLLILVVRLAAGRAMSARLRAGLWLLVLGRLMIPLLPVIPLSMRVMPVGSSLLPRGNTAPLAHGSVPRKEPAATPFRMNNDAIPQFVPVEEGIVIASAQPPQVSESATVVEPPMHAKSHRIDWLRIVLITWFTGASLMLLRMHFATARLARLTDKLDLITDPKIVELLAYCCESFNVRHTPRLLAGDHNSVPALVGFVRPKIILPAVLASQLSLDEIRVIFLHELAHLKRRDVLLNNLFAVLTALHWFNPLVWLASYRMAADRELACDEAVLRVTSRRHARLYGCTILKLLELLNSQRLPAGAVGVVQHKALIQRRIDMIASYPSRAARSSLLIRAAAVSLAIAAAVSAIRAQEVAPQPPVPAPENRAPVGGGAPVPPAAAPAGVPAEAAPAPIPAAPPAPGVAPAAVPALPAPAPVQPPAALPPADPTSAIPPASWKLRAAVPAPTAENPNSPVTPGGPAAPAAMPELRGGMFTQPLAPPTMAGNRRTAAMGAANPFANGTTQSVEDPASRQANAEVLQKLAKKHTADFHGTVLREALSYIADGAGIDVVIDERATSELGVDVNVEPVSLHTGSKPMEQILSLTLRLANSQLDYSIYNGVVFVSSREALNRRIVTRIYDLPSSVDHAAVQQMIDAAVGGARCNFFEQKIVITAPEVAQRDIARLLAQVEPSAPRASITGPGAMFLYNLRNANAAEVVAKFPTELGKALPEQNTNSVLIVTSDVQGAKNFMMSIDRSPAKLTDPSQQMEVDRIAGDEKLERAKAHLALLREQLAIANVKKQSEPSRNFQRSFHR